MNMNPDAKSRSTQPIVIECRRLAEVTGSWFSPKKWLRFRVTRYLLPTPASEPTSHYALFSCPDCGNKVRIYSIRPGDWDINRFTWLVTSGIALFLSILFLVACACGAFISVIQGPRVLVASLIHDTSLGLIAVFVSLALTCFLVAIRFFRLAWSGRIAGPIVGYHRVVCGPTLPFFGGTGMNPFMSPTWLRLYGTRACGNVGVPKKRAQMTAQTLSNTMTSAYCRRPWRQAYGLVQNHCSRRRGYGFCSF